MYARASDTSSFRRAHKARAWFSLNFIFKGIFLDFPVRGHAGLARIKSACGDLYSLGFMDMLVRARARTQKKPHRANHVGRVTMELSVPFHHKGYFCLVEFLTICGAITASPRALNAIRCCNFEPFLYEF